ncbi:MAG: acetyl-CoA carboxylase carboxyl transferase subunit alpha [Clostridiales bacterium]|jgi:acetyl-CoA carboxylase carboxyl transferase subunit alpha|nr:acetyl-CoA carboxylase carboxyl transferase subunit alpha [Clostridiales bacterium]
MRSIAEKMRLLQHNQRPNANDIIKRIFPDCIEMHGDRLYGDDPSIIGGISSLNGKPLTVIGQLRGRSLEENIKYNFSMGHPEGFRKSLRLMKQAEKFSRPVVCFVDTMGAYPGVEAEERGQSAAIANNLMEMMMLEIPIFSVLIGYGGSGGALALAVANEIAMLENALLSVISPQGCAEILWKDPKRYVEAADMMKMTAQDMYDMGFADILINEPEGGAHEDAGLMCERIKANLGALLEKYNHVSGHDAQRMRYRKFRQVRPR